MSTPGNDLRPEISAEAIVKQRVSDGMHRTPNPSLAEIGRRGAVLIEQENGALVTKPYDRRP